MDLKKNLARLVVMVKRIYYFKKTISLKMIKVIIWKQIIDTIYNILYNIQYLIILGKFLKIIIKNYYKSIKYNYYIKL